MNALVERSISLWKAQNGPIRSRIGKHLNPELPELVRFSEKLRHSFYIDYTQRRCDYV
ncbi:MAG: hypothetical protein AAFS13_00500 [Pseudomonadota bacterium]